MKTAVKIGLIAVIVCVAIFLLCGARAGEFGLRLYDGEAVVLDKTYDVAFGVRLKVLFSHRNDYVRYYETFEDKSEALRSINGELASDLEAAISDLEYPAKDAEVVWENGEFDYIGEADGVKIGRAGLIREIFARIKDKKADINVKKEEIHPSVTEEKLRSVTVKTGEYGTNYATSSINRKHNVKHAASFIDGRIIDAGAEFSFNEVVGARTEERGFKAAKIISNGKFVEGVGGGVCQVSTTLYNAALTAGLKIVTVHGHSLPVTYAPLSFDAMVSSVSDLVIKNDSEYPVYVKATAENDRLKFVFFGENMHCGLKVDTRTVVKKELCCDEYDVIEPVYEDATEEEIVVKPKSGYISEGYLDFYKGGELVESRLVRKDYYAPQKGLKRYVLPKIEGSEAQDEA